MSAGGSDMPEGGCITAGDERPGQRARRKAQEAPAALPVAGLLQAPVPSGRDEQGARPSGV